MKHLSRRAFITSAAAALPALALPGPVFARTAGRELRFFHTHTSERLAIEYYDGRSYLPDALTTVNQFLRDFRTGDVHEIDPRLLDLLHGLAGTTETAPPFACTSRFTSSL